MCAATLTLTLLPWLAQLRAQRERVDRLVDEVVQDYHAGFNKSIHNYSQILVLFTQAKEQVRPRSQECAERNKVGAGWRNASITLWAAESTC